MTRLSVLSLGMNLIAGTLFGAGSARASAFCDIKPASDGFIALRERPDARESWSPA